MALSDSVELSVFSRREVVAKTRRICVLRLAATVLLAPTLLLMAACPSVPSPDSWAAGAVGMTVSRMEELVVKNNGTYEWSTAPDGHRIFVYKLQPDCAALFDVNGDGIVYAYAMSSKECDKY